MKFLKNHGIKVILLIILLLSAGLSVYAIINGNSSGASISLDNHSMGSVMQHFRNRDDGQNSPPPTHDRMQDNNRWKDRGRQMDPGNFRAPSGNSSNQYTYQIIIYSIFFLIFSAVAYYIFGIRKVKLNFGNAWITALALLGTGFFLRIGIAAITEGHPFDLRLFKNWASAAAKGLFNVYSGTSIDYPPLYIYVLSAIGKLVSLPALDTYFTLLLKIPSILADVVTAYIIFKLARKKLSMEWSLVLAAFYIFNPAVFINSAVWGQVDSFFTLLITAALLMLSNGKIGFSSMLFTASILMKPQGIIFLPVLFFELVRQKSIKTFLKAGLFAVFTGAVIILPFELNEGLAWIFNLFFKTVGEYKYASVNAFNFFNLLGANYKGDSQTLFLLSYHTWGMIFIVLVSLFSWFVYYKAKNREFAFAAALFLIAGVFTLSARMHERYLFPAVALAILAFIYLKDKRLLLIAAGYSATVYMNTHYVFYKTISGVNSFDLNLISMVASIINVILLVYLGKVLIDISARKIISPVYLESESM